MFISFSFRLADSEISDNMHGAAVEALIQVTKVHKDIFYLVK